MGRFRTAYPPEFRRQMVELVRAGRTPEGRSRAFEPTAQSIWTWVRQADRDTGKRRDDPTSIGRKQLTKLWRENPRLRQERDILAKGEVKQKGVRWTGFPPNAWFARESKATPSGFAGS